MIHSDPQDFGYNDSEVNLSPCALHPGGFGALVAPNARNNTRAQDVAIFC